MPAPAVSVVSGVAESVGQGAGGAVTEAGPESVGAVPESAGPGCAGLPDAGGWHAPGDAGRDGTPLGRFARPEEPGWPGPAVPVPPPAATPLPSVAVRAPVPWVPPPPGCESPPWNTVLAWLIAWRNGCTPIETQAKIVMPASAPVSQSKSTRRRPSAT